ncbi:MAG: toll/interleukin-1 receptor domain-containing protein [Candidatus Nanopelagicaceae bacterium]|nr:toll/interleukin-1 receptor domain-containing protein [Candidatus Nanopelagicaceae bacterium]
MIFLSHTSVDKPVVEEIAVRLRDIFPSHEIFYDSWSIQPGDGIIDRMNEALAQCKLFLFFVSKHSLQSKMVELEWQNALYKATKGEMKIVPVKMDDCFMPVLLTQNLYIDLYGQGIEVALRQIIDVISGGNTFRPGTQEFSNLRAYSHKESNSTIVECRAEFFLEPMTKFIYIVENDESDLVWECPGNNSYDSGFHANFVNKNGKTYNAKILGIDRASAPGHPFLVKITPQEGVELRLHGVMHERARNDWREVPFAEI